MSQDSTTSNPVTLTRASSGGVTAAATAACRMPEPGAAPARALAYLSSQYPTLSMTFVLREVLALRAMGFRIDVASVNPPDRDRKNLTDAEAQEAQNTYHLKTHGATGALRAHVQALFGNFAGYRRGLLLARRLARLDLRSWFFNLMYFTEALMVGAWMKRTGHHHLHVHLASQSATVGLYVRTVFGYGFSITVHGPEEFYDAEGQYLQQKIAAADFICCISFYARSQLMKLSPYAHWKKLLVCRLGVDAAVFAPRPHGRAPDFFEILCVGRLTPAKGQHILIDAVDQLVRQGRRVRLRLVGPGPDEASLREHAAQNADPQSVVFTGGVNQDRIRELYRAADIFCLPSFAEGLPIALVEAMAMEIPCVTTRITGVPELIRDGFDGLLVPPSDLDGLTKALGRLMDDPELRVMIGKNARSRVLEQYDLHASAANLAAIFDERVKG